MKPSRKTITILNRSITFTRSWWVKIASVFSIVVFLFACEEDISELGFRNLRRFKVVYAEIPVEVSVLWMDSLRTNNFGFTGETLRLLAGSYSDPGFGRVKAQAYMQFRPTTVSTVIPVTAVYDSIVLQLRCDFYSYGTVGETTQQFNVHEIEEELFSTSSYFSNSNIAIGANSIGTGSIPVNQEYFKIEFDDTDKDSLITIRIKLSNEFGQRLFDAIDPEDESYTDFTQFKSVFKGLAVLPVNSDKIIGFNHTDLNSFMTLYYHDGSESKKINYSFSQGVNFSAISSDRSSSDLAGLNQYFTEFNSGSKGYVQAGTSVITKLDLSKFYEYTDSIPNLIINSAELEVADVETGSGFFPPKSLSLTLLRSNNHYKAMKVKQDTTDFLNLTGVVTLGEDRRFVVTGDQSSQPIGISYNSTDRKFVGHPTLFFQRLFDVKDARYPYIALGVSDPQPGKSVNRIIFPKDRLKLKIYYTRPNLSEN